MGALADIRRIKLAFEALAVERFIPCDDEDSDSCVRRYSTAATSNARPNSIAIDASAYIAKLSEWQRWA